METPETQTEQSQKQQTQEEPTQETTQPEGKIEEAQAATEPAQESTAVDDSNFLTLKVDGEERKYDLRDAAQREEAKELAQKGFNYTAKMQTFAEAERARQQQDQLYQTLFANDAVLKAAMANQMGLNPNALSYNPQLPDPSWEQVNPVAYGQALATYEYQKREKEAVERAVTNYTRQLETVNNQALFNNVKISNNLNDQEHAQVVRFMQENVRPASGGMYSQQQAQYAVNAVLGQDRIAQARLQTANNIQTKIKNAGTIRPAATRPEVTNDKQDSNKAFLDFVKEMKTAR